MRVGDFSVEVIAADGSVRELESGHVLARPGQVYRLRLRNHGPLRAVADVSIDGKGVTAGGLVLNPGSAVDLERPIHATERGRFTVIAEGDESVFGPDGGRDNPDLGLIEGRFRRELPAWKAGVVESPAFPWPDRLGSPPPAPDVPHPRRPMAPPEWSPMWNGPEDRGLTAGGTVRGTGRGPVAEGLRGLMAGAAAPGTEPAMPIPTRVPEAVERAAGTGLTGTSRQEFVPVHVGPLEAEATVIRLRLVIGTDAAIDGPRPLPETGGVPARPAARP